MTGLRRSLAVLGVVALAGASLVGLSTAAQAAPGSPGVPQSGSVIFEENFENVPGTDTQLLTDYVGAEGQRYTAAQPWLVACNGIIVNFTIASTDTARCASDASYQHLRQLAYALGVHVGAPQPIRNNVVAAYTDNNPGANEVQIETVDPIELATLSGRFLTFSVDTAAVNCAASAPQYQFSFLDDEGAATNVGGLVNACGSSASVTAPAIGGIPSASVRVGTYASDGALLFTGSTIGLRMVNANGSGGGNDAAFDNLRILDATPQLDKSFSPDSLVAGEISTLTLTITNTAELAAKNGWSFTDALPEGLTVAAGTPSTTCPTGVVVAEPGATEIDVTGNLTAGMESCVVTVPVTSATAGTYTNGPENITGVGIDDPADTTVEFVEQAPAITLVKSASLAVDEKFEAGDEIIYSFLITNTGNVALTDVGVVEGDFSGSGTLSAVICPVEAEVLAPTASVTCTATYTATASDAAAGSIANAATASGTTPTGGAAVSARSEVTIPAVPAPAIALVKTASTDKATVIGQVITYSFLVTNTGNVALSDVAVNEGSFSGTGKLSAIECPAAAEKLAPRAHVTCTATYAVTSGDLRAGVLTNTATATGIAPGGASIASAQSTARVTAVAPPLATTGGTDLRPVAAGALLLLLLGGVLILRRRYAHTG